MPNLSTRLQRPEAKFPSQGNPSTGFLNQPGVGPLQSLEYAAHDAGQKAEVSLGTGLCGLLRPVSDRVLSPRAFGERNESVDSTVAPIGFSNRKDRQKADLQPLLKTPNAARMARFAEDPRQGCAGSDEQVMDRGTERVAGGSDAI